MSPVLELAVLALGAFAGAFVAGVAGFGFAAAAGAAAMHVTEPVQAVPFLMVCSVLVQCVGLIRLRASLDVRSAAPFIAGGLVGAPVAVALLTRLDASTLQTFFGAFLLVYALHAVWKGRKSTGGPQTERAGPLRIGAEMLAGLGGGLVGGLTAMPGAVVTAWCDQSGFSKERQRGILQPFILAMQLAALVWLAGRLALHRDVLAAVVAVAPFLAAGVALGLASYERMDASAFRAASLAAVAVSGAALALS